MRSNSSGMALQRLFGVTLNRNPSMGGNPKGAIKKGDVLEVRNFSKEELKKEGVRSMKERI